MEKEIKINRFYFKKEDRQTLFRFKSLSRDESVTMAVESYIKQFPQSAGLRVDHLLNSICVISDESGVYASINIHDDEKATDLFSKLSSNPYFTELITNTLDNIEGIYNTPVFVTYIDTFVSMCLVRTSSLIASNVTTSPSNSDTSKEYAREMRKSVIDILNHYIEVDPEHNKSNWYKVAPRNTMSTHRVDTLEEIIRMGASIKNDRKLSGNLMRLMVKVGELSEQVRIIVDDSYYKKQTSSDGVIGKACDVIIAAVDLLAISGYDKMNIHKTVVSNLKKWQDRSNKGHDFDVSFVNGDPGNLDFVRVKTNQGTEMRISKVTDDMLVVITYDHVGRMLKSDCTKLSELYSYIGTISKLPNYIITDLVKEITDTFEKGGK